MISLQKKRKIDSIILLWAILRLYGKQQSRSSTPYPQNKGSGTLVFLLPWPSEIQGSKVSQSKKMKTEESLPSQEISQSGQQLQAIQSQATFPWRSPYTMEIYIWILENMTGWSISRNRPSWKRRKCIPPSMELSSHWQLGLILICPVIITKEIPKQNGTKMDLLSFSPKMLPRILRLESTKRLSGLLNTNLPLMTLNIKCFWYFFG